MSFVGGHDLQTLTARMYILRQVKKIRKLPQCCSDEAAAVYRQIKAIDPLDYWSEFEKSFYDNGDASFLAGTRDRRSEGQKGNYETAMDYYAKSIKANPNDAPLMVENDKINEKAGVSADQRKKTLEANIKTVMKYDNAVFRLLMTYNLTDNYDKAIKIMDGRHFHLWEGGGEIHNIYMTSHLLKGKEYLKKAIRQRPRRSLILQCSIRQISRCLSLQGLRRWTMCSIG